ncbi:hypothetical protein [Gemmiger sp. An194]|uniref:hypothetical protein n=1 Tax=Gemmiger sp. An194 TaxID=1965582 RepID=UPI00117BA221|nr:hypothetical protein [Gemmiger sp. An194]
MGSLHENDQKYQELHCLQIAVEAKKQQKGESRKILELLDGENVYRAHEERPDFVRRISPQKEGEKGILLGIEHFRVDHLAIKKHPKKGKKTQSSRIASVAPVLDKKKRDVYEKWNNYLDENGMLPEEFFEEAAQDLFDLAGEHMQKVIRSNYRSLLASLQQNLETHVKSIPTYQENLRKIAQPGEKIEIALLIDLYAEFFSLMKFDNKGIRACKIGEVPLFSEIITLIEGIIEKSAVNYVILCLNSSITERIPKVYAFRVGDMKRQIQKRHLKLYEYLAMDLLFEAFNGRPYGIENYSFSPIVRDNASKEIKTMYSCDVSSIDGETFLAVAYYTAWRILGYEAHKKNFCASLSDMAFAHAIAPEISAWRKVPGSIWQVRPIFKVSSGNGRAERIKERMEEMKKEYEEGFEQ